MGHGAIQNWGLQARENTWSGHHEVFGLCPGG